LVGAELEALLAGETPSSGESSTATPPSVELPTSRFATPSPVSLNVLRNNLPVQTTPFVGREGELKELETLLRSVSVRLLTVLATGGMGKTRVALELASSLLHPAQGDALFEQGIFFVDLAPLTSADNIVQTTGEALGYAFQQDGREARHQLLDYLR